MTDKVLTVTCEMAISEQVTKSIFQSKNLESFKGRQTTEQDSASDSTEWGGGMFQQNFICHLLLLPCYNSSI